MASPRVLIEGLRFPEGPVCLADGSVLVVEIAGPAVTLVADGTAKVVAEPGGGPNGAAVGPDGRIYLCNNGGCFQWIDLGGMRLPGPVPSTWSGGSIQRVDLDTGAVDTLYTECDGQPLRAPNDLVFDDAGGFWFTDHGVRQGRSSDRTAVYYARPDGSSIKEVVFPLDAPNGVGLSPDGRTLYVAETHTGRVWRWNVPEPGVIEGTNPLGPAAGELLCGLPGLQLLDSLAVDGEGWVCVGTLVNGGITVISPDGSEVVHLPFDDPLVTNIAFFGDEARAVVTLSATGRLVEIDWPRPGLSLAFGR
jgi:gluconolactonase